MMKKKPNFLIFSRYYIKQTTQMQYSALTEEYDTSYRSGYRQLSRSEALAVEFYSRLTYVHPRGREGVMSDDVIRDNNILTL